MSQEIIDKLNIENQNLKNQVSQFQSNMNGLIAQFDASKQMFNESLASNLQLRTNIILLQKNNTDLSNTITELNKTINILKSSSQEPVPISKGK